MSECFAEHKVMEGGASTDAPQFEGATRFVAKGSSASQRVQQVCLLGSYNGQDSLGDKGLLSAVVSQFTRTFSGRVKFIAHVGQVDEGFSEPRVEFHSNADQIVGACLSRIRPLKRVPVVWYALSFAILPLWWLYSRRNRALWRAFFRDCRQSDFLYFYGGTQLSSQWFDLNFPTLLLTIAVFRLLGKPVYFGPQQYGPLTGRQRRWMKGILRWLVTDYRVRNRDCWKDLGSAPGKLILDEIYSCRDIAPLECGPEIPANVLLVNFRGQNFVDSYAGQEIDRFCRIVEGLSRRMECRVAVLQMSGPTFCDDSEVVEVLKSRGVDAALLPHTHDVRDIVNSAKEVRACFSMSFHGCILAMLAGRPAVPVTSGGYYDRKYCDFDRYTGEQGVPLVRLDEENCLRAVEEAADYFDRFSTEKLVARRTEAVHEIEQWYEQIAAANGSR